MKDSKVRGMIVTFLLFTFSGVIAGAFVAACSGEAAWDHVRELLNHVFPVLTTLVGGAIGYYFRNGHP